MVQVLLPGGPTTYGLDALAAGMTLAQKIVGNYGLTQAGVTMYATPAVSAAGVRSNYEVSVEQIDEDVVGQGLEGGMYQASDKTIGRIRMTAQELLREAYNKDVVSFSLAWFPSMHADNVAQQAACGQKLENRLAP